MAFVYASQRRIYTEHGQILDFDSYADLADNIRRMDLLAFTDGLGVSMVYDAMARGAKAIWNPNAAKVVGLLIRNGRRNHYLMAASHAWPGLLAPWQLPELRKLLTLCDVGDHPTPASLGQALMRRMFPALSPRLRRPTWEAWQELYDGLMGGRAELFRPGYYAAAIEEDIDNAYPTALRSVPAGDCRKLLSDPLRSTSCAWWYARYRWLLPDRPVLPLLGVRDTGGHTFYPSTPRKWFDGWYTKDEILTAEKVGYELRFVTGWGFDQMVDVFSDWSSHMASIRSRLAKPGADWIKLVGVAGIGRFGRNRTSYEVVAPSTKLNEAEWSRVTSVLDQNTSATEFLILERDEPNRNDYLIQVALKVHADIRLATYFRALPYKRAKLLIATNFDAIYIKPSTPAALARARAEVEGIEDNSEPLQQSLTGETFRWKQKTHTNARFPKKRWILSDQAIKTPGVSH